jgi:hypothetical protein
MLFEALKGERRTRDVAARHSTTAALEALSVATVHHDARVDIDATHFGKRARTRLLHEAKWADEFGGQTPRRRAEQLHVRHRRAVTRREDWLVACEGISSIADAIEASAMPLEHSEKARVGPRRDLRDVLAGAPSSRNSSSPSSSRTYAPSSASANKMDVEPERAVGSLHKRERA